MARVDVCPTLDELGCQLQRRQSTGLGRVGEAAVAESGCRDHLMQGRPPLTGGVGVGALVQQKCCQLVVGVDNRQDQHAEAIRRRFIDARAAVDQRPDRVEPPRSYGKHQGRHRVNHHRGVERTAIAADEIVGQRPCGLGGCRTRGSGGRLARRGPGIRRGGSCGSGGGGGSRPMGSRIDVGSGRDKGANRRRVPFGRRPHQRGLSADALACIHVGAASQQDGHGIDLARPGGGHQWRLATRRRGIRIGSSVQQHADDRGIPVRARERQRGNAVAIGGLWIRAGAQQQLDGGPIVELDRPVERRRAVRVGAVWIGTLPQQRGDAGSIAIRPLDRLDQRALPRGGADAQEREQRHRQPAANAPFASPINHQGHNGHEGNSPRCPWWRPAAT